MFIPESIVIKDERFVPFISREQIDARISLMGKQLDKDYKDLNPIFIGVLNGSFIFLADLMRHVQIPCEVDFVKLSSYGDQKVSSGNVITLKKVDARLEGRHIILVEDIVDTGLSMNYMLDQMKVHKPASVAVITLLHKKEATVHPVSLDYVGFEIPNAFVLGYGLDYAQQGRNLGQIYILENKK
ncbi:MAG: hypoxanthine phosphoribosyltransferase [Balneola sp.]|nr:hypoxanthine phosphoribosyltransferase [Balneola sp.]